jgi:hypothetical protein
MLFDAYFSVKRGAGFPAHRKEPQGASRQMLTTISACTHRSMAEILTGLPESVVRPALTYPGMPELIDVGSINDPTLKTAIQNYL